MSRIGRRLITINEGVVCHLDPGTVSFQGGQGSLQLPIPEGLTVTLSGRQLTVALQGRTKKERSLWGYFHRILENALRGVERGFERQLELSGVGYRVKKEGESLIINIGFSHPVKVEPPEGIRFALEGDTKIKVLGIDKQRVGETAAKIRAIRPPEPYKGKGIKYQNEVLRKKAGKAGKVGAAFGAK